MEGLRLRIPHKVMEDSLRHFAGRTTTREELLETCWRFAGNLHRLKAGMTVLPWTLQRGLEWVPLEIVACRRAAQHGNRGAIFSFRILAGSSCPRIIQKWWSQDQCWFLARNFGFSKLHGRNSHVVPKYPMTQPDELVGMRLFGLIEPALSRNEPVFRQVHWTHGMKGTNRELLKKRFRVDDGYQCPENKPSTSPCHHCPTGYVQCAAATHRFTWRKDHCPSCNAEAWFDPELKSKHCVRCTRKEALNRG